jgi:hypothetical protein
MTITILDTIHRIIFYLKHDVSESALCLRLQVEPRSVERPYLLGLTEHVSPEEGGRIQESSFEFGIEPSGSIKCWETIEWPNNWWPVE